jgi:hypothetical protein
LARIVVFALTGRSVGDAILRLLLSISPMTAETFSLSLISPRTLRAKLDGESFFVRTKDGIRRCSAAVDPQRPAAVLPARIPFAYSSESIQKVF